ncbi:PspC domain-containing protein [Microbacterium sp. LTA6]|uniref:PspC domain-containing protein n=1 Tax=Microbacterium sp. LTA6 TaxID=3129771 RepID=UPI00324EFF30
MTIPTAPPPAADTTSPAAPVPPADKFFLWVADLGVIRSDGWLGGVCAGIAARLRIDPLIVRGVFVVAALFGLPAIFLYAVAWALLPDADGRVHTRDLLAQDFQPTQLGILGMAVIGLIPTAPITGSLFGFWYADWTALSVIAWIVGLVLVGTLIVLIVRAARHTPGASAPRPSMASTNDAAPDASPVLDGSGAVEHADALESDAGALADSAAPASALLTSPPPAPAPLPERPENPEDLDAWRRQHAAWKEQDQAWRRQQQDAERAARDQARRERQTVAAAFAAEAAERRRIRRASNPRASFALVASVIGLALVAGAAVGLWSGGDERLRLAVGLLSAALVLAVGMIIAGALRRRSGFLAFLTVLVLVGGAVATGVATLRQFTFGDAWASNAHSLGIQQPFGNLDITLDPYDGTPPSMSVEKGTGSTLISVSEGVELDLEATVGTASIVWKRVDPTTGTVIDVGTWQARTNGEDERVFAETISAEGPIVTRQKMTIEQTAGEISITVYERKDGEE